MARKKLPIGIQTFATIRGDDYYYVDKTGYAMQVAEGRTCFLSRPRRFGKSLFLDTLGEMFAGNKALFEGLECYDVWDWDTVYPVVRLSFGRGVINDRDRLVRRVRVALEENAVRLGVDAPTAPDVAEALAALIMAAEAAHGQQVVVLVDEYDKPILDNLDDPAAATALRDGLRDVYSVLKDAEAHLRFVMLTGVSKFAKVNVFSGLNNLDDISLSPRYSAVCGYTEADLDAVFVPELDGLDRAQVRAWYNGYNWRGDAVYNPFDLLLLFRDHEFGNYWFETGTPSFLPKMLAQRGTFLPWLADLEADETDLATFDVEDLSTVALLFQSGYLTIDPERSDPPAVYRLKYPNDEVRTSLSRAMLRYLRPMDQRPVGTGPAALPDVLAAADTDRLREYVQAMFAGILTDRHRRNPIASYEGYYASVFYAYFVAAGLEVITEDAPSTGRVDMTVRTATSVWLFEFKVTDKADGSALTQIKTKGYADQYRHLDLPIYQVGVEFSPTSRNVVGFDVEAADR